MSENTTYGPACPRCGAMISTGGCLSCGYPNGSLREMTAADTALAEKSKGDPPLGYVRYELLAEAWDWISKLGRELFDARTRIGELEAMYETSHKSRLHAEDCVKRLEAELAVLSGTACAEEQAEGNGPCGACRTCRNKRITELEAENAKLRKCVKAADDFVETVLIIETSQAMHRVYSVALAHGAPYNGMDWSKQLSTYRAARAEVKP